MRAAPHVHIPNPFHVDPVSAVVSAVTRVFSHGVQSLASWAFARMITALLATTQVSLGGWFDGPWRAMLAVAGLLAVPVLLAGVATEVIAGQPAQALRRGVLYPLAAAPALLAARALLGGVLALVDGACALVVQVGIGGPSGFGQALDHMGALLGVTSSPLAAGPVGVGPMLVVLVAAFLAFVIWVELACRAALVLMLVAFVPLAFAGLFWRATASWTRRLLEVLGAVILAQLVITVLMVLAAASLTAPGHGIAGGVDTAAVGLALLFLGSLGLPMTFRLLPHVVEAAAAAGSGAAVAGRLRSGTSQLLAAAPSPAGRLASTASRPGTSGSPAVAAAGVSAAGAARTSAPQRAPGAAPPLAPSHGGTVATAKENER